MEPWPFQEKVISEARARVSVPSPEPGIIQAPTGSGKSEIMAWMAKAAVVKGKRVGLVVNRRVLVEDLCKRVSRSGLDYGVIMASDRRRAPWKSIQVASFDTLWRMKEMPKLDLVMIDECHFSLSEKFSEAIARLREQGSTVIGFSATPMLGTGEGLGSIYKWMVRTPDTPDLVKQGFLVPTRVFSPFRPNLKGVKMVGDDYNQKQVAEAVDRTVIIGDILKHFRKNLLGRPTIGFGVNLEHCRHMTEIFLGAGIKAEYVDHTSTGLDMVWSRLANYETQVVFNVGICGYGWDVKPVSGMIEARPTASLPLWVQHAGRVKRIFAGKVDSVINDHAGNCLQHGHPDEERDWPLDGKPRKARSADDKPSLSVAMCKECYYTFRSGPDKCPACGHAMESKAREVEIAEGELQEIAAREKKAQAIDKWKAGLTVEQKAAQYAKWQQKGRENNYNRWWAINTYRRVFGEEPPRVDPPVFRNGKEILG